jgi:cysteine desulfurase
MRPIFLDHHSTTAVDPRVLEDMLPWFAEKAGNPHSVDHSWGWEAEEAVEKARRQVAALAGALTSEVIFTSGATEANNLAIFGIAAELRARRKTHILVSPFEHPSVTACLDALAEEGFTVEHFPVEPWGLIDPDAVVTRLRPETGLVSCTTAQHDIGTLQPISFIVEAARKMGALVHTDATQAAGRVSLSGGADLVSMSAHKLYGPKGIGALIVRKRIRPFLKPRILGGGQEDGMRSGTLPVPLAVGFGAAATLALTSLVEENARTRDLRQYFLDELGHAGVPFTVNGIMEPRLPGNLNLRVDGVEAATLIAKVRDRVAISAGSACSSAKRSPAPALIAIGLTEAEALSSVRIGLGRFTSEAEIEDAVAVLAEAWLAG